MYALLLAPDAVQLVGAAALPIVEALDSPVPPRAVASRARPALERLAASPELPFDLRALARTALVAALAVQRSERASYAALLRATRQLLDFAGLPVPCELCELDEERVRREVD